MAAPERRKIILDYLRKHEFATSEELAALTGASLATVRRDLVELNNKKLIIKNYGSVRAADYEEIHRHIPCVHCEDPYYAQKEAIALQARELISEGDIIFLGSGLTCNLLAKCIKNLSNITIVTTNINAVIELAVPDSKISILLLGGNVNVEKNYTETLDEYTIDALKRLYFDKAFFTVDGINLETGYSINNRAQLPLYNYLINNSKSVYLLADQHKFNKRAFAHLGDMNVFKHILTTGELEPRYDSYFKKYNIECIICPEAFSSPIHVL